MPANTTKFGTDEHSLAMLGQWRKSKVLRDPQQLSALATEKGLTLIQALTADAIMYSVISGATRVFYGSLEAAGAFIDNYTLVSAKSA